MAEVAKLGRDIQVRVVIERYEVIADRSGSDGTMRELKARFSLVQSGQHVEYVMRVHHDGKAWAIQKRFNEVAALHEVLRKRLPLVPEPPAKSVVRQFNAEYLEARKVGLQAYLDEILKRRDVVNCAEVQDFLALPANCPAEFAHRHSSEPVRAAEVHDSAFGVADFVYDPVQGLLLIGASDASWTSRMDTRITNIKLPWEPAAPNLPTSQMSLWRQSPAELRFEMLFTCRYTPTISCVCLAMMRDKGLCLCGLSDGTVGCHAATGNSGASAMGNALPLLRHTASVRAIAFDDADQWVITASKDNALMVYDLKRQMIECEVQTPMPTASMRYCQSQKRLFTGLQNGKVIVWDLSTLPVRQVGSIPDAQSASGQSGGVDVQATSKVSALDYDSVTSTIFMAQKEGCTLWTVRSGNLGVWGRRVGSVPASASAPTALAWANSSREIIAGFASGAMVVFDADKGAASYGFQAHSDEVTSIQWLDAPRRLLTGSKDKTLKIWDFPSLRRMPLEEQPGFIPTAPPPVSVAPHAQSGSRSSRGQPQRGTTSFDPADPLGGSRPPSASSPPLASYTPTSGVPPPLAAGSTGRPGETAAPERPAVAGARPGTTVRDDSDDDDLAGWAR